MDNFTLFAIANELSTLLVGHRIGKVFQFGVTDLALDVQLRDHRWLYCSTDPKRLACYLTSRSIKLSQAGARNDTPFVSLCKKYLSGAQITAVEFLGYDRVLRFSLAVENEDQSIAQRALVVHLTGRSANIFLLEENQIIATLRDRNEQTNLYVDPAPPTDKIDPFECPPEKLNEMVIANAGDVAAAARLHLLGFGLQYAKELAARAHHQSVSSALSELLTDIFEHPPRPFVYAAVPLSTLQHEPGNENFALTFAPIELRSCEQLQANAYPSVNQAADAYYTIQDQRRAFLAARQELESSLTTRLKKLQSLQANLIRERENFSKGELHQRYGELLLANLHQAIKVDSFFEVTDFYAPEQNQLRIPAANQATAKEAAEHYFKLARKARHGIESIQARLPEVETQIKQLQQWHSECRTLKTSAALQELKEIALPFGLGTKNVARVINAPKQPLQKTVPGARRYRSSDQYEILVGRTSRDNDYLTLRVAKSHDIWLHAADYPGSHVILKNPRRTPVPQRSLIEAAQLAAKFSQANNGSGAKVAVNYCEKKFVTKPKGFGPGQVRLTSFKTMIVAPDEAGTRE